MTVPQLVNITQLIKSRSYITNYSLVRVTAPYVDITTRLITSLTITNYSLVRVTAQFVDITTRLITTTYALSARGKPYKGRWTNLVGSPPARLKRGHQLGRADIIG